MARLIIICGKYDGMEKKAVNLLNGAVFDLYKQYVSVYNAEEISESLLSESNVILVGTKYDNRLIKELCNDKIIDEPVCQEGCG